MKVVIRHQSTGRYYCAPGKWVRRADNALAFDDAIEAKDFLRSHHLNRAQAVYRLAPFLMHLLHEHAQQHARVLREAWPFPTRRWYSEQCHKFDRN